MQRTTALSFIVIVSMQMQSLHPFLVVLRQDLQSPICLGSPRAYSIKPMGLPHFTQEAMSIHRIKDCARALNVMNPKSIKARFWKSVC